MAWQQESFSGWYAFFYYLQIYQGHANNIQAVIIVTPALHPTWAHESLRLPHRILQDETEAANRVIEYPSQRYTDDPEAIDDDARREIADLNNESRLALQVESSRDSHPSKILGEEGVWRGENGGGH